MGKSSLPEAAASAGKVIRKMGRSLSPCNSYSLMLVLEKHRGVLKSCTMFCFLLPLHPCSPPTCGPDLHTPLLFSLRSLVFSLCLFLHHLSCPSAPWAHPRGTHLTMALREQHRALCLGWPGPCPLLQKPLGPDSFPGDPGQTRNQVPGQSLTDSS